MLNGKISECLHITLLYCSVKEVDDRYRKETEQLRKKLRWYAENQQLLDADNEKLRQAEAEVQLLRVQLCQPACGFKLLHAFIYLFI